jgi:hypothetical protein
VVHVELDHVFDGFQALNLGFAQPVFECLLPFISYSPSVLVGRCEGSEAGPKKEIRKHVDSHMITSIGFRPSYHMSLAGGKSTGKFTAAFVA